MKVINRNESKRNYQFLEFKTFFGRSINQVINLGQLIIRIMINGTRPKILKCRDQNNNINWYAYYPLSGVSKVLVSETEIQKWLKLSK